MRALQLFSRLSSGSLRSGCIALLSFGAFGCGSTAGETTTLRGELVVYAADRTDGSSTLAYALRRPSLPEMRMEFASASAPRLATGTPLRVEGQLAESGEFLVSGYDVVVPSGKLGTSRQAIVQPTATRRFGLLLIHFGEPDPAIDVPTLQHRIFGEFEPDIFDLGSTKMYFDEVSFGALNLEGDIFDWIEVPPLADPCDTDASRAAALAAAAANDIDLSSYDHVGIYMPVACANFGGQGELGSPANPARFTWYYFNGDSAAFVHEIGHNLGFFHADTYSCGFNGSISTPDQCMAQDSSDPADVMGFRFGMAHTSAYHKTLAGWFDDCNVVTAPAGGDFTLEPLEIASSSPQALRIPVHESLCPAGVSPCYYYVEYRQPIGLDGLGSNGFSTMHEGASIRIGGAIDPARNESGVNTKLLTMRPATPETPFPNFNVYRLGVGETFVDPTGLSLSVLSNANQRLVVRAQVPGGSGTATCFDGTSTCQDGIQDGSESDVDCGGSCARCTAGSSCNAASDCSSNVCDGGVCAASPVTASLHLSSQWQTGYCAEITIRNEGTAAISSWLVRLNVNESQIYTNWLAQFTPLGGSLYDVTPFSWNSSIQPGQAIAANFCANKTGPNFTPQIEFAQ